MIKEVKHEGNTLVILSDEGQRTVNFKEEIKTVLKFENSVVVRTAHDPQEGARNIHRINQDGVKIWMVEESEGVKGMANAFVGVKVNEKGELIGVTWQGLTHKIDFETGKILSSIFTK